jgi:hypothetical protein
MTRHRPATLVLVLGLLSAGPVLAQGAAQVRGLAPSGGAAATLPNAFDGPVAPARPVAAPGPTSSVAQVTEAEMAEAALRSIIGQIQAGDLDETLFTPGLATRLNGQLDRFTPMVNGFGPLKSIEAEGTQSSVGQFRVTFDKATTQWRIGLEEGGLVAALLFREAPVESSAPPTGG